MRRFGRRRFIGASAAAVCVGCTSHVDGAGGSRSPSTGVPLDELSGVSLSEGVPVPVIGAPVRVGRLAEVRRAASAAPTYVVEAKAWLVALTNDESGTVAAATDELLRPGLEHGLLALSEKCPHLGCRVPYCDSSGWFECFCHGSQFTRAGEHRGGPGPRGLDAFPVIVDDDVVFVGQGDRIEGAPIGTVVLDLPSLGPHCIDADP